MGFTFDHRFRVVAESHAALSERKCAPPRTSRRAVRACAPVPPRKRSRTSQQAYRTRLGVQLPTRAC
eukprot:1714431-Pleurochrysis_carterae.AAC.1